MLKGIDFCHLQEIYPYEKTFLDAATKTRFNAGKNDSKKVAHKTLAGTGELIGKKIAEKIVKTKTYA